jgi:adenylate cyclase
VTSRESIAQWLAEAGLRNLPLEELVDGFTRRLIESGVPVARVFVGMNTLHSMLRAKSMIWDRTTGSSTHFRFQHSEVDVPIIQQSPFVSMVRDGVGELRRDLTLGEGEAEWPVFAELRASGMTDWLGRVFAFGELMPTVLTPEAADGARQLFGVCSFTTDRTGGYTEAELETLRGLLPLFGLAVKATTLPEIHQGLLASYLGSDPAARVLAGSVQRGTVQSVEAVLFYSDLRDFTALTDTMEGRELIALLDECFDCMVKPVTRLGGEVLKFMGDGLLAIFRTDGRRRAETCGAALSAASEALDLMELLARRRQGEGKTTPGLDIALHVGRVQYGNVGTDTRLDFTVIGPAVNEAARIELLCKELGHPLLVSEAFADAATTSRAHLTSLGRHRLRGVREPAEIFTLSSDPPSVPPT